MQYYVTILLVRVQQPKNVEKRPSPLVFAIIIRSIASNSFTIVSFHFPHFPRILTPSQERQGCGYVRRCSITRGGLTPQRSHRIVLICVSCPSDKITYLCVSVVRTGKQYGEKRAALSTISRHLRRLESQFAIFQKDVRGTRLAACARRGSIQSKGSSVSETCSTQQAMDPAFRLESSALP